MTKKSKQTQTHVYDSDSNVDAYEEGECKIGVDERLQMVDGVDGDFSNHCLFCLRKVWNCRKQECRERYKAMAEFEKRQLRKWKGKPRKKKRKANKKNGKEKIE